MRAVRARMRPDPFGYVMMQNANEEGSAYAGGAARICLPLPALEESEISRFSGRQTASQEKKTRESF